MKKVKFIIILIVGLFLLLACEEGAKIKIYNKTNHALYVNIENQNLTIEGQESKTVNVDTQEKVFLIDDGKTKINVALLGETYRIWDDYDNTIHSETIVDVTPGETYKIYCNPNSASVKIINNSDYQIDKLLFRKHTNWSSSEVSYVTFNPPLERGDFAYHHLQPQTEENRFFYSFIVLSGDVELYSIGDEYEGVELFMDEQHLIEIFD